MGKSIYGLAFEFCVCGDCVLEEGLEVLLLVVVANLDSDFT